MNPLPFDGEYLDDYADDVDATLQGSYRYLRDRFGMTPSLATTIDVLTVVIGGVMIGFAGNSALLVGGIVLAIVGLASLSWRVMR